MPKRKRLKVPVRRDILLLANKLLGEYFEYTVEPQHLRDITRVQLHLKRVLKRSEHDAKCEQQSQFLTEQRLQGQDAGKNWFFAFKQSSSGLGQEADTYELYLCLKSRWFDAKERFPWKSDWPQDEELRLSLAGAYDADSGLYWYSGSESDMEERRQKLLESGMEEKPEILNTLRKYPPERKSETGDFSCPAPSTEHPSTH